MYYPALSDVLTENSAISQTFSKIQSLVYFKFLIRSGQVGRRSEDLRFFPVTGVRRPPGWVTVCWNTDFFV